VPIHLNCDADLALEFGGRLSQCVDQRSELRLGLVEKQQQVQLQVTAEDLLRRLLRELHYQRKAVLRDERSQRFQRHLAVLQLRMPLVKLTTNQPTGDFS